MQMAPEFAAAARRPLIDLLMGDACAVLDGLLTDAPDAGAPRRFSTDARDWTMHEDQDGAPLDGELQGMHVLLVDDCTDALVPLALLLELCGAEVETAHDGREALACIEHADAPFDVLVSDLRMPGMSGLELIRHVRGRALLRQPVAIACSGFAGVGTREVIDAGFDAMLAKPLAIDALERTILSLCAARSVAADASGRRRA